MTDPIPDPIPIRLGRYRITSCVAQSSFGSVYRAWDDELRRDVAIKTPHREYLSISSQVEEFLAAARQFSQLDHPFIVPVYDVGRTDDGYCYLVTKFFSGGNLSDRNRRSRPSTPRSVHLVVQLADALHFAHKSGLVHGNIKPAHILFDDQDQPSLTEFGLSQVLTRQLSFDEPAGGHAYSSPEQLCGEHHRVDARTDIYSLGVILYELLAGEWPLCQRPLSEVVRLAMRFEPTPLSDYNPMLHAELIRICQRAMSRRVSDRYTTIVDFAADLQECVPLLVRTSPPVTPRPRSAVPLGAVSRTAEGITQETGQPIDKSHAEMHVIPKGLRSYDREDADFYLELLPGPRGRDGLPEVLQFWKSQIEETDPDQTFSVGLIYGPSGCGKSSLVKAGLLPRLGEQIVSIHLEATPGGTETRLLAQLRRRCPYLPANLELIDALADLRRGKCMPPETKIVLFLDQFEQWLHASRGDERPVLSAALRQCDGRHLQCVIMVRDDFWMAVTRFMHGLEVNLVEGQNSAAVDLFSLPHARKVLTAFGQAYECLPYTANQQSREAQAFIDLAVEQLAHDGKVISVQLALFAQMVKNKRWVPATLDEVGGAGGIGLAFLEETFSSPHAPPEHRRHQRAARAVLRLLLPEQGTDIKGQMHSRAQLLGGSGFADRPQEFDELMQILDQELRLVTPADSAGLPDEPPVSHAASTNLLTDARKGKPGLSNTEEPGISGEAIGTVTVTADSPETYYQLTHDFLVPSIRRWLIRKQQETRRGRAELLLEEKSATWNARPERRYLPTTRQWLAIRILTSPRDWSNAQKAMMNSATFFHTFRAVICVASLALLCWGGFEAASALRAQNLRDRLLFASSSEVPSVIREMAAHRRWINLLLHRVLASSSPGSPDELRVRLALLPADPTQLDPLFNASFTVDDETMAMIIEELLPHREGLIEPLWNTIEDPGMSGERRLRAGVMLARYAAPKKNGPDSRWVAAARRLAKQLHEATLSQPGRFQFLVSGLKPVKDLLIDELSERSRDVKRNESDRSVAGNILIEYATDRPDILTTVLLDTQSPTRQAVICEKLQSRPDQAIAVLELELAKRSEDLRTTWNDEPLVIDAPVDPATAVAIDEAGGIVTDRFALCQTLELARFRQLADGLASARYCPTKFRPYLDGDIVRVAAVWARDGRKWTVDEGLSESEMQRQISGPRMKAELLLDLAAYEAPTGEMRHTALWSNRRPEDPDAKAYIGASTDAWNQARTTAQKEDYGVVSFDFRSQPPDSYSLSAVLWKQRQTSTLELRGPRVLDAELQTDLANRTITLIDAASVPFRTLAESRAIVLLERTAEMQNNIRANPENLALRYYAGQFHFLIGQYALAIADFSHFIDNGGEKSPDRWMLESSHELRAYAAARLGNKTDANRWIEQRSTLGGNDLFSTRFRATMLELFSGDLRDQPEAFDKFAAEWPTTKWAPMGTAHIYAVAAGIARQTDPARAADYADRAIENLEKSIKNGEARSIWWFLTDPFFQPIVDNPGMIRIQFQAELDNVPGTLAARKGDVTAARNEVLAFQQKNDDPGANLRAEFLVEVLLGNEEAAHRRLKASLDGRPEWMDYWVGVAGYSVASHVLAKDRPERAREYADLAFEILNKRVTLPWGNLTSNFRRELQLHWLFAPLQNDPRMAAVLAGLDRQYSIVSMNKTDLESQVVRGMQLLEHRERCQELANQGFRPVSIDACIPAGRKIPEFISVWQRPSVGERQRDEFARRQATAAVAMFRLGKPQPCWPLLKSDADPTLRTWMVQHLGTAGADPLALAQRLAFDRDLSVRFALLIALGKSAIGKLSSTDREVLIEQILALYRSDPDPGIHSAAEWTLKKWSMKERIDAVDADLRAMKMAPHSLWSINGHGRTMVSIQGPAEFSMGTPSFDPDHVANEFQHRRAIPRRFAISTTEVTVRQWEEFVKANRQISYEVNRIISPDADCPAGKINWYQMSAYCRWLSEEEGINEEEIGYPPYDQIRSGMQLKPYVLSRSGYRVATEAEWEYACRGGANTRWSHGESVDLLPQYAWFKDNAEGRTWAVGTLPPNEFGLFDMEGNLQELCLDCLIFPKPLDQANPTRQIVPDDAFPRQRTSQHLSYRGGSYAYGRSETRCGRRWDAGVNGYDNGQDHVGFRIVKTLIPRELEQARLHRRQSNEMRKEQRSADAVRMVAKARDGYQQLLATHPENGDYAWELADFLLEDAAPDWQVLEPVSVESQAGTKLSQQPDGSILASGNAPPNDVYTLRFETDQSAITAIRLELMPDRSLPGNGPGRAPENGNFHLSEIRMKAGPRAVVDQHKSVLIPRATSDFSQAWLPVSHSIDADENTAWGIAFAFGQPHWAIFEFADPIQDEKGIAFELTLEFLDPKWKQLTLGRFRISATRRRQAKYIPQWRSRLERASLNGWARLAVAYAVLERPEDALAALSKAGKNPQGEFTDDMFLMALIHWKLDRADDARTWLERGLARYDKKTDDMWLKQLAADTFIAAAEQQPVDLPFLRRIWNQLGRPGTVGQGDNDVHFEILLARRRMYVEKHETEKAAEEYARMLDLLPPGFDWLSPQGRMAFDLFQTNDVFERLTEMCPGATGLWIARGRWHLFSNRWQEALADYAHVVKFLPIGDEWTDYAALLLLTGDESGYREFMESMVQNAGTSPQPREAYFVSRTNSLSPSTVAEPTKSLDWATLALTDGAKGYEIHVLGLAQLRCGNYEQAIRRFHESRTMEQDAMENRQNLLGLAIAEARAGKTNSAREWLRQSVEKLPKTGVGNHPTDWLEVQLLRREAESLLLENTRNGFKP